MKISRVGLLVTGLVAAIAVALTIGIPPRPTVPPVASASSSSVTAGGFTLASTAVDLPVDDGVFPAGPHADLVNANCTSCHSASMALTQPPLSAEQWTAEVTKMREVYRAPVAETDVPAIVAYLTGLSAKQGLPTTAKAQDPDSKAAPKVSGGTG
ncbi:hypothetical protein [Sphingomonas sp.]|uniref:hypothetical protein n=1 Tax=Sphingomonas sp. TaxID=28214 RepID=UPI0035BC740E